MPYGDYSKISELGRGSYVKQKVERKFYAIKMINLSSINIEDKDKCTIEFHAMNKLDHPNVIELKESYYSKDKKNISIVMTYCDGADLSKVINRYIKNDLHLKEASVMNYFVQILLGLDYIHSNNIIHRDIKPANILLLGNGRALIGDFGCCKILENASSEANTIVGTPYFMAPELYNQTSYTNKVDIWSLGVLLYYMVTKKYPFEGNSIPKLSENIKKGNYKEIPNIYSYDMKKLIGKLLKRDPKERPSTTDLLKYRYVQKHLVNFFRDKLTKSDARMTEGTINIKNAIREYAKRHDFNVSDVKSEIPYKYKIYEEQLKNIGILDKIVSAVWNKREEKKDKLAKEEDNKNVIKEALEKLKEIKEKREKRNLEKPKNQNNPKIKKNRIETLIINTEYEEEESQSCFTPTMILDSGENVIDIHGLISKPEDGKENNNDLTLDLLNQQEKNLIDQLAQTKTNISNLEREINENPENDSYNDYDSDSSDSDSDSEYETANEEYENKENSLKRRCEEKKNELKKKMGEEKFWEVYNYLNEITRKDDCVPTYDDPEIVIKLTSFIKTNNVNYIIECGKSICDIIFMERFN